MSAPIQRFTPKIVFADGVRAGQVATCAFGGYEPAMYFDAGGEYMRVADHEADKAAAVSAATAELRRECEGLRRALSIYADPGFYHGCAFTFDRPTGGFDADFSQDEAVADLYERPMPGKTARECLAALNPPPPAADGGDRDEG